MICYCVKPWLSILPPPPCPYHTVTCGQIIVTQPTVVIEEGKVKRLERLRKMLENLD